MPLPQVLHFRLNTFGSLVISHNPVFIHQHQEQGADSHAENAKPQAAQDSEGRSHVPHEQCAEEVEDDKQSARHALFSFQWFVTEFN